MASVTMPETAFARWFGPILLYADLFEMGIDAKGRLWLSAIHGVQRIETSMPEGSSYSPIVYRAYYETAVVAPVIARLMKDLVGPITVNMNHKGDLWFARRDTGGHPAKLELHTTDYAGLYVRNRSAEESPSEEMEAPQVAAMSDEDMQVVADVAMTKQEKKRRQWREWAARKREKRKKNQELQQQVQEDEPLLIQRYTQQAEPVVVRQYTRQPRVQPTKMKLSPQQRTEMQKLGPKPDRLSIPIPADLPRQQDATGKERSRDRYRDKVLKEWDLRLEHILATPTPTPMPPFVPVAALTGTPAAKPKRKWKKKTREQVLKDMARRRQLNLERRAAAGLVNQAELSRKRGHGLQGFEPTGKMAE